MVKETATVDFISGRRSFDRQIEMLTIAVHTLQRDFAALEERVRGIQASAGTLSGSIQELEDELHKLDKALVARIATISVTERILWMLATGLTGLAVHFFMGAGS